MGLAGRLQLNPTITEKSVDMVIRGSDIEILKLLLQRGVEITPYLLELAINKKVKVYKCLEEMKKDFDLKQDQRSELKLYQATCEIERVTRLHATCEEIISLLQPDHELITVSSNRATLPRI